MAGRVDGWREERSTVMTPIETIEAAQLTQRPAVKSGDPRSIVCKPENY